MKQTPLNPNWLEDARLWLVLDLGAAGQRSLIDVTREAANGGVDAVICRIKDQPYAIVKRESTAVREVCREIGIPFIMSHYPELAVELHADGVQIGVSDPAVSDIRAIVGHDMVIGYSTHGVSEARQRFADGVDYVFLGPIFPTPDKLKYGEPLGIDTVNNASCLPGPVVFIGGINFSNISTVIDRGGQRVAVISAIQRANNPETAAREMKGSLPVK